MVKELNIIRMEKKYTKVQMIKKKGKEKDITLMGIIILGNGKMIRFMGKVFYMTKMERLDMMGNISMENWKEMGNIIMKMKIIILANLKIIQDIEKEYCISKMEQLFMMENF